MIKKKKRDGTSKILLFDDADLCGAEDAFLKLVAGLEDLSDGGWLLVWVFVFEECFVKARVELVADGAVLHDTLGRKGLGELGAREVDALDELLERGVLALGGVERVPKRDVI